MPVRFMSTPDWGLTSGREIIHVLASVLIFIAILLLENKCRFPLLIQVCMYGPIRPSTFKKMKRKDRLGDIGRHGV